MPEQPDARVAVYIDFDNIVISRFEQMHRKARGRSTSLRGITVESLKSDPELDAQVKAARVDLDAVLDFASSFGTISVSRAYADWSIHINASYKDQLMDRAVDLVQLFPAVRQPSADRPAKNGADIRLAVDVVEDLFLLPDIKYVVIVAGDSDYIALAQRCKRLGRYVVGVGVAGSTSKFLASACDQFADYDALLGVNDRPEEDAQESAAPDAGSATRQTARATATAPESKRKAAKSATGASTAPAAAKKAEPASEATGTATRKAVGQPGATALLRRALLLSESKDDADWISNSAVKNQMLRLDPSFQESALGYKNFTDFVKSRQNEIELKEDGLARWIRRRATGSPSE